MNQQIITLDKSAIRRLVAQLKNKLSENDKLQAAYSIFEQLEQTTAFRNAQTIALYWSLADEVCTHAFIEKWYKQKTILLPIVDGETLVFKQYTGNDNMQKGAFGILEPQATPTFTPADIEIIIVPGIAFDKNNNRMGRGRGFYDRLLSTTNAIKIGIAYNCQLFSNIPTSNHDIAMDIVITNLTTK